MNPVTREDIRNYVSIARGITEVRDLARALSQENSRNEPLARSVSVLADCLRRSMEVIGDYPETSKSVTEIANLLGRVKSNIQSERNRLIGLKPEPPKPREWCVEVNPNTGGLKSGHLLRDGEQPCSIIPDVVNVREVL